MNKEDKEKAEEFDAWINMLEDGLGRELTKSEKEKEWRLMN